MYGAIKSLYKNPRSRIVLTEDYETNYFECRMGVKQGDSLSPTLFAIYVNSLADTLTGHGAGVNISDNCKINSLFFADDLVLIALDENNMQLLLNLVNDWCSKWRLEVNILKTNLLHIRKKGQSRALNGLKLGSHLVLYCEEYKYLGLTINEFLDMEWTVQNLYDPACRALSQILSKSFGGFPPQVLIKLYDSCVASIIDYGS